MPSSKIEEDFLVLWKKKYPLATLDREKQLIPDRRFRFDFVHNPSRVAIEIQGGTYSRLPKFHGTGRGLDRDYEKNNLAQYHGYLVFQLSCKMITETWIDLIYAAIQSRLGK
jgi:very-short-patch-repair endonuclease